MPVDVAALLRRSRAANDAFHVTDRARIPGRVAKLKAYIIEARTSRMDADAADPEHADPAWLDDTVPHAEILAYYDRYLETH